MALHLPQGLFKGAPKPRGTTPSVQSGTLDTRLSRVQVPNILGLWSPKPWFWGPESLNILVLGPSGLDRVLEGRAVSDGYDQIFHLEARVSLCPLLGQQATVGVSGIAMCIYVYLFIYRIYICYVHIHIHMQDYYTHIYLCMYIHIYKY